MQKKYQQRRKNGKKRGLELILSTMTSRQKWRVLSKMYIALDVKPVYLRTKAAYHCYLRNTLTRNREIVCWEATLKPWNLPQLTLKQTVIRAVKTR